MNKKKRLAVDFDNTLFHTTNFPEVGNRTWMNKLVAWYVRRKKKQGWVIILNTLREKDKGLDDAVEACRKHNVPIDYVNENYPPDVERWGESRKIACNRSIDDTNIGLTGWLLRRFG